MAKADLEEATRRYDQLMELAVAHEKHRRWRKAITTSLEAWQFAKDMMAYSKKYEGEQFASVSCVDLVYRLAPLVMDRQAIEAAAALLKAHKAVDRIASDDLAARLDEARQSMSAAHWLWARIEETPMISEGTLRGLVSGSFNRHIEILASWTKMGLVLARRHEGDICFRLATDMAREHVARCARCGDEKAGPKRVFLQRVMCPKCGTPRMHVIGEEQSAKSGA